VLSINLIAKVKIGKEGDLTLTLSYEEREFKPSRKGGSLV
jgi:hypothetical protein